MAVGTMDIDELVEVIAYKTSAIDIDNAFSDVWETIGFDAGEIKRMISQVNVVLGGFQYLHADDEVELAGDDLTALGVVADEVISCAKDRASAWLSARAG